MYMYGCSVFIELDSYSGVSYYLEIRYMNLF